MNEKPENSASEWVDPDDAPEWTDEMFERADVHYGGKLMHRGRPTVEHPKQRVTLRLDEDVVSTLRASGPGWQTRVNQALRQLIERGQI